MNKKIFSLLSFSAVVLASSMYMASAHETTTTNSQAAPLAASVYNEDERIPWANTSLIMEEINHEDGNRIVTKYVLGANGEWRSEILEHPDPFGVGLIQVWDKEKFYSYYPMIDTISIRSNYAKNERVRPNPMLGSILANNVKHEGKAIKNDAQVDVYSKNVVITKEIDGQDKSIQIPAEQHYDIDKATNEVRKIETLVNGKVIRSVSIKNIERNVTPDPALFKLDLTKVKNVNQ